MLTTAQLRSPIFDRLTGRLRPPLPHPTSKSFERARWREIIKDDVVGDRDYDLASAAIYIGGTLQSIRSELLTGLFDGLSRHQLIELAVADANRGWNIFRWKLAVELAKNKGEIGYIPVLGREGIPVGPNDAMLDVGDANTAVVDALPYWFAEAADAGNLPKELDWEAAREIMHRGHLVTNLMQLFRSIWQEVLWEPWSFRFDHTTAVLAPREADDLSRWRAWDWRDQSLFGQSSLLSRNLERDIKGLEFVIPLTASAITMNGIEVGAPNDLAAMTHRSALENVYKSYLACFLDEPIGNDKRLTIALLEKAVCVLQDLVELRLPRSVIL